MSPPSDLVVFTFLRTYLWCWRRSPKSCQYLNKNVAFSRWDPYFLQRNLRSHMGLFWGGEGSFFQLQRMKRWWFCEFWIDSSVVFRCAERLSRVRNSYGSVWSIRTSESPSYSWSCAYSSTGFHPHLKGNQEPGMEPWSPWVIIGDIILFSACKVQPRH